MANFFDEKSPGTLLACSVYEFAFSTVCINIALTCLVRILCLINLTFVEESVGENRLRTFLAAATLVGGMGVVTTEIMSGDILAGLSFNLLTGNQTVAGNSLIFL
jgi:hypothetical protein